MRTKQDAAAAGRILRELLFPLRCPVCDRPVDPPGEEICRKCRGRLIPVREPKCPKCGKQLQKEEAEFCADCRRRTHLYDEGAALYSYQSCRRTIYRLKYAGRQEYAAYLGRMMARGLGEQILSWNPDALIPVPLHPARERKRGYNQAALLARSLGEQLGIPVLERYLVRTRNTRPQKELEGGRRQNNLKKAFKIIQNDVKLKTIVIIDDIYTTGSTVDAIAGECRNAGIDRICYAALAIGRGEEECL